MIPLLLLALACGGGSRAWADRPAPPGTNDDTAVDTGTDPGADTSDTDTSTDPDSGDTGAPVDTGPAPLDPLEGDPCVRPIPADARVVRGDVTSTEDRVRGWVCRGGMFSAGGFAVETYVEARGDGLLSGTGGRAWVRASGRLVVYAGPNEIWVEDGAELTIEAEGVVVNTCPTLTFTQGPADGC
ncbi:MAG: hypothetical protein ACK4YP_16750 [Myxococcota bacterium]